MPGVDAFLGTWDFDPASAAYEAGEPPRSGDYTIAEEDGQLNVTMRWVDAAGAAHDMSYVAYPDGKEHELPPGSPAETMKAVTSGPRILDTITRKDGAPNAIGRRTVSRDGQTMHVVQSALQPDGRWAHNASTYRKRA